MIGSEGFGWAFIEGRLERIPQVGNVVLEDDVEIGANSCIDRAQTGSTLIGAGTKIDNLVQIGHNCRIGKHCAIAALTGLGRLDQRRRLREDRGPSRHARPHAHRLARDGRRTIRRVGRRARRRDDLGQSGARSSRDAAQRRS